MTAAQQALNVVGTAQALLEDIPERFASAGNPLPERRIIIPGDPEQHAWDCEQFTVGFQGLGWGQAEDLSQLSPRAGNPMAAWGVRHVVFALQIVRCAPNGGHKGIPSDAAITSSGERYGRDMGLLSQALVEWVIKLGGSPHAQAGAITPGGTSGGYYGLTGSLSITMGDLT